MSVLADNPDLLALKKSLPESTAPAVTYKEVEPGTTYTTVRHGIKKSVYVEKVKKDKDQIVLKRDKDAVDSFTESRARFDKFYTLVTPRSK